MNQNFEFINTEIPGLIKISVFNSDDSRGSFTKDYSREIFVSKGIDYDLREIFYTTSHKGVIRGLHFQRIKQQPKLVRCIYGHIWDVIVDLRRSSRTFCKWLAFDLTGEDRFELLIPGGCAHGYLVLEDSVVSYKCEEQFYSEYDDGIIYSDPDLKINWPYEIIGGEDKIIVSSKDMQLQTLKSFCRKYGGLK